MSYDPSKMIYTHSCGKLPCECKFDHQRLEVQIIKCIEKECARTFLTMNDMQEHHMECRFNKRRTVPFVTQQVNLNGQMEG